jgi:hypothetical protein
MNLLRTYLPPLAYVAMQVGYGLCQAFLVSHGRRSSVLVALAGWFDLILELAFSAVEVLVLLRTPAGAREFVHYCLAGILFFGLVLLRCQLRRSESGIGGGDAWTVSLLEYLPISREVYGWMPCFGLMIGAVIYAVWVTYFT